MTPPRCSGQPNRNYARQQKLRSGLPHQPGHYPRRRPRRPRQPLHRRLQWTSNDAGKSGRWFAAAVVIVVIGVALTILAVVQSSKSSNTPTSTSTSTSTATTAAPSTSAPPSGPNETIADYIKNNNIQETTITPGTPGAPTIDLPVPEGWTRIPEGADAQYFGIVFDTPTNPDDPPKIIATVEKLTGNVDTDKLLAVAAGEAKNLPGYDGGDAKRATLSGFPASRLGGLYTRNGVPRMVAQNTVVIQSKDGIYVMQIKAEGPEADADALRAAARRDRPEDHDHALILGRMSLAGGRSALLI